MLSNGLATCGDLHAAQCGRRRLEREEESTTEMHVELLIETQQEGSGTLTIDMRQERSLTREPL